MKTSHFRVLAACCCVSLLITSCGEPVSPPVPAIPEKSFEAQAWTPALVQGTMQETSLSDQEAGGVFSFGTFGGRDAYTQAYTAARADYVTQVEEQQNLAVTALGDLEKGMSEMRSALQWHLLMAAALHPDLRGAFVAQATGNVHIAAINHGKLSFLQKTNATRSAAKDDARAALSNLLYVQALDLSGSYNAEMSRLYAQEAFLETLAASENDAGLTRIANSGSSLLQAASEKAAAAMVTTNTSLARMHYGARLLATADYHFAQDVVQYLETSLPALKQKAAGPGSKFATTEDKALLQTALTEAQERLTVLKAALALIPEGDLLSAPQISVSTSYLPRASAGFKDTMSWFGGKLSGAVTGVKDVTSATASLAWSGVKTTASVVKTVAITGAKVTGQVVGTVIESADATIKTTVDTGLSVYYGESPSTIIRQAKDNYGQAWDRISTGHAGADTYKEAKGYMEGAENKASELAQKVTEKVVGKGITSTTLGFLAKTTVGFFTGVAKDSYDVLNPDASEEDTLMGMFGLALTAVGGSGTAAKPSELIKDGVTTTKNLLVSSKNLLSKMSPSNISGALKDLFKDGVSKTLAEMFSKKGFTSAVATIDDVAREGLTAARGSLDDVYNALHSKITKDVPEAWKGLFEKKSLGAVLDSAFGTTGDTATEWLKGYLNNVVSSSIDDQIKNGVKSSMQYFSAPDEEATAAGSLPFTPSLTDRQKTLIQGLLTLTDQEKETIKDVAPTTRDAAKKALEVRLEALKEPPVAKFAGTYNKSFPYSFTTYGIRSSGTINLTVNADKAGVANCSFTISQRVSGSYQGIAVNGTGSGKSSSCNGTVKPDGSFSVSGSASGFGSTSMMGSSYSGGTSMGFTIDGRMANGGMSGTLSAGGYSFGF